MLGMLHVPAIYDPIAISLVQVILLHLFYKSAHNYNNVML